jgi:hypothetical protein
MVDTLLPVDLQKFKRSSAGFRLSHQSCAAPLGSSHCTDRAATTSDKMSASVSVFAGELIAELCLSLAVPANTQHRIGTPSSRGPSQFLRSLRNKNGTVPLRLPLTTDHRPRTTYEAELADLAARTKRVLGVG